MNHASRTLTQAVKKARAFEKFCETCGCRMMTAYTTTKYCGDSCRKVAYNKKITETEPPTAVITCEHCKKDFPWWRQINSKKKRFCSQGCAAKSGSNKGNRVHNGHSLLVEKPCTVERSIHCHRKIGPFEVARCKHYHLWGSTKTQFHCDCVEGFTL